jgi:porin
VGLLSQWCIADEQASPFQWSGNVGIQAQGPLAGRPLDSAGVGYFYTGLSNDFQSLLNPVIELQDINGVELYYNAALAKYFGLTADFQVIEPAEIANDTALVFGLRGTFAM